MNSVLQSVRAHALQRPSALALRGARRSLTYAELVAESEALAWQLGERGIRVLALAADNAPEWVIVDLAAQRAGITLVPLPPFFSLEQLEHVLTDSGAEAVVADAAATGLLDRLDLGRCASLTAELALYRRGASYRRLPVGTAKISYTSGTTGRPKGVCLSRDAMHAVARSLASATASLEIERHLCVLPLATLLENVAGVYAPLLRGAEVVVPGARDLGFDGAAQLDIGRLLASVELYQAESLILLPQMLASIVAAIEAGRCSRPESLQFMAVGGGKVSELVLERADRLALPVYEGYGLTECASVVALSTPAARRRGSVGRPLAHAGVHVGSGSELIVRGSVMLGYVGDTGAAQPYVATGDIGHIDPDGYIYIDGRCKDVFISSFGRNVSPEWVEADLVAQDGIAQAAIFGEARPWNTAVIVPAGPLSDIARLETAIAAANARLPRYAQVQRWILAAEPFTPANGLLTQNGRIRRAAIWDRYADAIDASYRDALCYA